MVKFCVLIVPNVLSRVSFRFLPKRGQNKDICKVGELGGASILSKHPLRVLVFMSILCFLGREGGTVIMHSHVSIGVPA